VTRITAHWRVLRKPSGKVSSARYAPGKSCAWSRVRSSVKGFASAPLAMRVPKMLNSIESVLNTVARPRRAEVL
jgi:hypothetical protein